jgi:hypothetical protein
MLWNKIPETKAPDTEGGVLNDHPVRGLFAVILVVPTISDAWARSGPGLSMPGIDHTRGLDGYPSDHFPVTARLQVSTTTAP